uniref:Uncharacterized protein n=1 Tax=Micrurus spixii TaxID=129469 RepID=A0A2D4LZP0_9SAUR
MHYVLLPTVSVLCLINAASCCIPSTALRTQTYLQTSAIPEPRSSNSSGSRDSVKGKNSKVLLEPGIHLVGIRPTEKKLQELVVNFLLQSIGGRELQHSIDWKK